MRARALRLCLLGGAVLALGLLRVPSAALAAAGDPDPSFGSAGLVTPTFCGAVSKTVGGLPQPTEVLPAGNGDVYVAGQCLVGGQDGIFVARFLANGAEDTSYGDGGEWTGQFGTGQQPMTGDTPAVSQPAVKLALTASGELIVATHAEDANGNPQIAVAELTSSGQLDPKFATDGVLLQQLSAQPLPDSDVYSPYWGSQPFDVAVDPDGRILLAGYADTTQSVPQVLVERLDADGAVDTSFGTGGVYEHQFGVPNSSDNVFSAAESLLLQPDGDIVLAIAANTALYRVGFAIDRLTPNGNQDPSFAPQLVQVATMPGSQPQSFPYAIAQTAGGDYVVAGRATDGSPAIWMAAAEFTSSGPLDSFFATDGIFTSDVATASAGGVSVRPDGDIVLTSGSVNGQNTSDDDQRDREYLVRLTTSGALDSSFGTDGVRTYNVATGPDINGIFQTISNGSAFTSEGEVFFVGTASATNGNALSYIQKLDLDAPQSATGPTPTTTSHTSAPHAAARPRLISMSTDGARTILKIRCASVRCGLRITLATGERRRRGKVVSLTAAFSTTRTVRTSKPHTKFRIVSVGSAKATLPARSARTITITLNAAGRRLLKAFKRLPARVTIATATSSEPLITRSIIFQH